MTRQDKANQLVESNAVSESENGFTVSGSSDYHVDPECQSCTCPDYSFRGNTCKHILAATLYTELSAVPF